MTAPSSPPAASPPGGMGRRLAAGIGAQGLAQAAQILGQLLAVPVFLATWGAATYADWLALSAAAGMLGLADFGLDGYLGNSLRAAGARGDETAGRRVLQSGLGLYAVSVGLTALAVVTAAAVLDVPARLGVSRLDDAGATLLLLALTTTLLLPRPLVATIHAARGHFHREVMALLLAQTTQLAAGMLTALAGGTPLHAAAAQFAAALAFGWGALLWGVRRHYGALPLRPMRPTAAEFRLLARKAPLYAVQQASVNVLTNLPVVLLGWLAPGAAVVAFTTMRTFTGIVRQTARQAATALGLEMARMHVRGDDPGAGRLYADSTPLVGCAVALLVGAAWVCGPAIFALWTHGAIGFDPLTGAAFLAGALLQVPAYCAAGLLRLVDRPGVVALIQGAEIAGCVLLGALLIPWAGAAGAALGIVIAETLTSTPWSVRAAGGLLKLAILRPVVRAYALAAVTVALVALAAVAAERVAPLTAPAGLALFAALWSALAAVTLAALGWRWRARVQSLTKT